MSGRRESGPSAGWLPDADPSGYPPGSHPVPDQRIPVELCALCGNVVKPVNTYGLCQICIEPSLSFTATYGGTEPGVPAIALPTEMDETGARIGSGDE